MARRWPRLDLHDLGLRSQVVVSVNSPTEFGSPISTSSVVSSTRIDRESDEEYDTPLTSPSSSPIKADYASRWQTLAGDLDGGLDSEDQALELEDAHHGTSDTDSRRSKPVAAEGVVDPSSSAPLASKPRRERKWTNVASEPCSEADRDMFDEKSTPLAQATKAINAGAFPFPPQAINHISTQRHPSELLRFCEQRASPRQRRLMAGALESPDRFIPSRLHTPTKEALLIRRPRQKWLGRLDHTQQSSELLDPFGPGPARGARSVEQFATIRRLPATRLPRNRLGGTMLGDRPLSRRAVSSHAVWTVGGTVVTEGVLSTTNGRGGRVTSGTSAPHYTADFLRRQSPSEEQIRHGRRLAIAMEVEQGTGMLAYGSRAVSAGGILPNTPRRNHIGWTNSTWERDDARTPHRIAKKKPKDIPIIPFRVLDAPALRDDYYCSLLAYSENMQCLAVGLGPHVYLWSEKRGTTPTHVPESLSAPSSAHVTSVSFSSVEGGSSILAIGRADGRITLWSPQDQAPRFDSEQPAPVSCVSFRPKPVKRPSIREPTSIVHTEELLVGDELGNAYLYSIEWPSTLQQDLFSWSGSMTLIARIKCHSQQICGIAWSSGTEYFATGGNDNHLYLFETQRLLKIARASARADERSVNVRNGHVSSSEAVPGQGEVVSINVGQQKHLFTLNAAVKAIAFAPWQSTLLAARGGSNDRCIHFFHASSGATLATIDCHAQVTSLIWSEKRKEIAATLGFAQPEHPYRVAVFAWPSCCCVVRIPWYGEERALYAVSYPGGPASGSRASPSSRRRPGAAHGAEDRRHAGRDAEGSPWSGRQAREEGCLVIATSDASIKFHEVWADLSHRRRTETAADTGSLGGSQILEDDCSPSLLAQATIR